VGKYTATCVSIDKEQLPGADVFRKTFCGPKVGHYEKM
jgi:hypothetical protein